MSRSLAAVAAIALVIALLLLVIQAREAARPMASAPAVPTTGAPAPLAAELPSFAEVSGTARVVRREPSAATGALETLDDRWAVYVTRGFLANSGSAWYRIEYVFHRREAIFGWVEVPRGAEGLLTLIDLECPKNPPTLSSLGGMQPAERLRCYGERPTKLAPVFLRREGVAPAFTGSPEWLAVLSDLWLYGLAGSGQGGTLPAHIDPALPRDIPLDTWLEVTGQFDHAAADGCQRTPTSGAYSEQTLDEQRLWCRQQLVITSVRPLFESAQLAPPGIT
jgi:hypothetical protein